MASEIKGRDINGMRAVGWSKPNLAAIQSIKVKPKCSNAELFDAIKQIVGESVLALRGTNADDKYRNIVDMLMLRIRGALAKTIEELKDGSVDIDISEIAEDVSDAAVDMLQKKIDPENGLVLIDKNNLKELVDVIAEAVSGKVQDISEGNDSAPQAEAAKPENTAATADIVPIAEKPAEKVDEGSKEQLQQNAKVTAVPSQATAEAQTTVAQSISIDDINNLQTQLDTNFKKIESLIQSTSVDKAKQSESEDNIDKANDVIVQSIVVVEKTAEESNKKLEEKTAPPLKKEKEESNAEESKNATKDVLTGKQFVELLKMLAKNQTQIVKLIDAQIEETEDQFEELNDQLEKIYDHLNKSKISWLAILAGVSLFLLPFFWDKIMAVFTWIDEKFQISDIIDKFISSIDWGKYVGKVTGFIWDKVKKKFQEFIQDPMGWIVDRFKGAYDNLTKWIKDIWKWIKEKINWTKKKQDENEAKAEKASTEQFEAAMTNLEQHTGANVQKVQENTNAACEQTTASVAQSSEEISGKVGQMQESANEHITATTEAVQQNSDNINNTVLPGMNSDLEKSVDGAGQKVENKAEGSITAAENKLEGQLDQLDKKIEENGAPTSVSKETLAKMDAEGEGANVGKGGIDQKVEGPKTVVQTTTEQQGKTVQLYAKKDDVDRAAKENGEVNELIGNNGGMPNVTTNVSYGGNTTQANIQNKILVNGTVNPAEKEAKTYEDIHVTINEVSKNSATIEDGLKKNRTLLGSLKEKVNDYFIELNSLVKTIKDKPPAQHNSNVVVVNNGNGNASPNPAQMKDF